MNVCIVSENFELNMDATEVTCTGEQFTYINIQVKSDHFYILEQMRVYSDDVEPFFNQFTNMYANLEGSAYIEEPYGNQMYLEFLCDKKGHITIDGFLHKNSGENTFIVYFTGKVDQSAINIA